MTDLRSWHLDLPITRALSLNDRGHWSKKAGPTRELRGATYLLARHAKIPRLERFTAVLHLAPRHRRRRDPENLVATLKPAVDGLIDAGVAVDDCPPFYVSTMPVITEPTGAKVDRFWLVVQELAVEP